MRIALYRAGYDTHTTGTPATLSGARYMVSTCSVPSPDYRLSRPTGGLPQVGGSPWIGALPVALSRWLQYPHRKDTRNTQQGAAHGEYVFGPLPWLSALPSDWGAPAGRRLPFD